MEQLTLEQAANYEPPIPERYCEEESQAYTDGHKSGFIQGANWQKEQYKLLFQLVREAATRLKFKDERALATELIEELELLQD